MVVLKTENTETVNSVSNSTNVATANANNPLSTTATPEIATTNNAPTISPVVKAYYDALKVKMKRLCEKFIRQDTLKSLEADMKEEKENSLIKFITDLELVPDKPFEARNEKIEGDTADCQKCAAEAYPNGIDIKFVKENGEWKMTNESPDFDAVKKSAANSNTAK